MSNDWIIIARKSILHSLMPRKGIKRRKQRSKDIQNGHWSRNFKIANHTITNLMWRVKSLWCDEINGEGFENFDVGFEWLIRKLYEPKEIIKKHRLR